MKIFLALTCCVALAAAFQSTEFETFKSRFRKSYRSAIEENFRYKIFIENLKIVHEHNVLHRQGKSAFTMAINKFADLTSAEFTEKYNGYRQSTNLKPKNVFVSSTAAVPDSIDWRESGYVTGVKDQGNCGSCWAFSATGSLEGQHFKSTGNLVSLSEQNLVDCSEAQGNSGCNGGWMNSAFDYVIANGGIATEASYPYEARDGRCRFRAADVGATARSYTNIARGSEIALQISCAENGPISVAIDASGSKFQLYENGVYDNPTCSELILNHGVLVVGYGTENGEDYWLVKNSWGTSWGDKGYIKMSRNKGNQCGIVTEASFPII